MRKYLSGSTIVYNDRMLELQLDRTKLSIVTVDDDGDEDKVYWHSLTPQERLEALEWLRQHMYDYDPITVRLQRILEIVE